MDINQVFGTIRFAEILWYRQHFFSLKIFGGIFFLDTVWSYMGVSLNGGTIQKIPTWSFVVGKPIVVG